MNKINILGTEYEIIINNDDLIKMNADGLCNYYSKRIDIRECEQLLDEIANSEEQYVRHQEVLRHEVIHAFLNESGLMNYSNDETLVNWIAMQFPKMFDVFEKLQCVKNEPLNATDEGGDAGGA